MSTTLLQTEYGADDPVWIDEAWLDTVVVVGLTCFVLCLMNLSKVCESWPDGTCLCVARIQPARLSLSHTLDCFVAFWIHLLSVTLLTFFPPKK
jgi:hypothetical protein